MNPKWKLTVLALMWLAVLAALVLGVVLRIA